MAFLSHSTLSRDRFRRACGHFATGVAVLTCAADGSPHGLTVNSFASLSLDPPLVMAAVAFSSNQLPAFDCSESFAINILNEAQQHLSARFAKAAGGKFSGVTWEAGLTGAPLIEGAIAALECRVVQRIDTGDHRVLIGEVLDARLAEGRPLLYFKSSYSFLA